MRVWLFFLVCVLASCVADYPEPVPDSIASSLSAAQRRARATQIRNVAASRGITEGGWLLAGIADAETYMSQCWSELTWACQGPDSVDCGGGPVVAGRGDGECREMQGGLGMFQFDGGTHDQTLVRDGRAILTVAGNIDHAVDFVLNMVRNSDYISGVDTDAEAIAWMNGVAVGNARWEPWYRTVTHYYNGCRPSYSCYASRSARYRDFGAGIYTEMGGAEFWGAGAASPEWVARYVGQSFPLASMPFELESGEVRSGYIEMENAGSETWRPGEVFLGTTEPRDGASPLEAADWVSSNRAATIGSTVAPGATGRFSFSVRGPAMTGDHAQFFNLVREGVEWFSSPADDQLQIRVTVTGSSCPAGTSARWTCSGDTGRTRCLSSAPENENCMFGCLDDGLGAVCASAPIDNDMDGYNLGEDCDDNDSTVHPGVEDPCGDGIDADCDGNDVCPGMTMDGGPGSDVGFGADASLPPDSGPSGLGRGTVEGGCAVFVVGTDGTGAPLGVFALLMLVGIGRRRS